MEYLTLARGRDLVAQTEVKRSKFLAAVRRTDSEDAAKEFIDERRRAEHTAGHHCSAYVIGADVRRANDDGEPAGTAGQPILDVLTGAGLVDVTAVVTRYFGGTLLGAGGLIRAYSEAASLALTDATLVRRRQLDLYELTADHAEAGRIESELRNRGVVVRGVRYAEQATLTLAVQSDSADALGHTVAEITGAESDLHGAGTEWIDLS